jgi:type III secretion protein Q
MLTKTATGHSHSVALAVLRQTGSDDWLPTIAHGDVALLNAFYRHRRPIDFAVGGHTATIDTTVSAAFEPAAPSFRLTLAGRPAILRLPADVIELCERALGIEHWHRLGAAEAGMLLELVLLEPLRMLEAQLRMEIRILERIERIDQVHGLIAVDFRLRGLPVGDVVIGLFLDHQIAGGVARALDAFAVSNPGTEQVPVPVRIHVGGADLTLRELRGLRPGDIILCELDAGRKDGAIATVGGRLYAHAERTEAGLRLASELIDARTNPEGDWFMQQPSNPFHDPAVNGSSLEQLTVRLVFELGRVDVSLAELRRFAPGYVLSLAPANENTVDILANGRKVGRGALVKIGDSIGVCIERIFSDD